MRGRALALGIAVCACGSDEPENLQELDITRMSVTVDFDAATPEQPQLVASLVHGLDADSEACPDLDIAADLDGVALASSPGGTGKASGACQLGYVLTAEAAAGGAESTIRFSDASGETSFTVARLLESRVLVGSVADGSVVTAGEVIAFPWPVDTDTIEHIEGVFVGGPEEANVDPSFVAGELQVTVPSLAPGVWTLSVGVLAHGRITRCEGDAECTARLLGEGALSVSFE